MVDQTGRGTTDGKWAPEDPAWDEYAPDNTVTGTATRNWVQGKGWVPVSSPVQAMIKARAKTKGMK